MTGDVTMPVYGKGQFNFNFSVSSKQNSIKAAVTALVQGSPPDPLIFQLYSGNSLLASGSVSASEIGTTPAWTPFVTLDPASPLSPGEYTLRVSTTGGDSEDYYRVFMNLFGPNWQDLASTCGYTVPSGWTGPTQANGWSVIWVQDSAGNDLEVLPFGISESVGPLPTTMSWTAATDYQINFIAPWLSDMESVAPSQGGPKGYQGTWTLTDATTGQVIGAATSNQWYNSHGIMGIIPIQFPSTVDIVKGHTYQLSLTESQSWYTVLLRGSTANPPKGSLTGNSPYWYGQIGLADFSAYRVLDSAPHVLVQNGSDGIGTGSGTGLVAVRFVPNHDETLTSVSIKMYDGAGTVGNYSPGVPIAATLYASNENAPTQAGAQPTGAALASANADSGSCPFNGFLTISGLGYKLSAGTPYWIVWSAPTATTGYCPQRNVSPFRDLLQVGHTGIDGTWYYPGQGPSDLAWYGTTSNEILGSPLDLSIGRTIDAEKNIVAQPFSLVDPAQVNAIYVQSGGYVRATVYPDDGSGSAPNMSNPLGTGSFNNTYQYFYGGVIIPLTNYVYCAANTKYWVVFQAEVSPGSVVIAEYWTRPADPSVPSGYEVRTSTDGGSSWSLITQDPMGAAIAAASVMFMVGVDAGTQPLSKVMRQHGITTKGFVAYGQPFSSDTTVGGQSATNFYRSLGFLEFPWEDGSDGYSSDLATLVSQYRAVNGGVFGPLYGWGYATQFYNLGNGYLGTLYPSEQEYYLDSGSLVPAQSYGYDGIVIDAPELKAEWAALYSTIDEKVGLTNLLGTAGWLQSDHPVNYAGAQGADGGHNMNTYARYVNNKPGFPTNFYLQTVNSSGMHNSDGSACLLWALSGQPDNFSSSTCKPTLAMAKDVSTYHKAGGASSSFVSYYVSANASLEYALLQQVQVANYGLAIGRTAMPSEALALVPNYAGSILELMAPSVSEAFGGIQRSGGATAVVPYINWANSDDNSSNPGGGYGVATAGTTLSLFLDSVPYLSHLPFLEVDTDTTDVQTQAAATPWPHFGGIYGKIQVDGWFGYVQDRARVLVVDHYYNVPQTWSALALVSHMWGLDSEAPLQSQLDNLTGVAPSLSSFAVVIGWPALPADQALVENYVKAGGNLLVYTNSGVPDSVTGIGTTAVKIPHPHPILAAGDGYYQKADLDAAMQGGNYGYINDYGSGKVVTLTAQFYGDGFGINSEGAYNMADALSGGLGYLTLNAILWLSGRPSPAVYLPRYVQRTSWAVPLNSDGEGGYSGIGVHLLGVYNGAKSIWLSSNKVAPQSVAISFSAAFYGYSSEWALTDLNTGKALRGTGDVELNLDLPSSDWIVLTTQLGAPASSTSTRVIIVE